MELHKVVQYSNPRSESLGYHQTEYGCNNQAGKGEKVKVQCIVIVETILWDIIKQSTDATTKLGRGKRSRCNAL